MLLPGPGSKSDDEELEDGEILDDDGTGGTMTISVDTLDQFLDTLTT